MQNLESLGISTRPATHAVHMLQYYKNKYKIKPEDFSNSYIANQISISLPLYNGMTDEIDYIIGGIKNFIMCGIAGILHLNGSHVEHNILKK